MTAKTTLSRNADASVITRMCSINLTGVVFYASKGFEISSELSLCIHTSVLGITREWDVQGWVVECKDAFLETGTAHQVTMLFSTLPGGLQQLLKLAEHTHTRAYPPVNGAEIFGLN